MKLAKVSTSHIKAVTGTTFVATLSSLLFGYATAVIAGAASGSILQNHCVEISGSTIVLQRWERGRVIG